MKPEMCTNMPRNLSEKLEAKFLENTLSYSMVEIACGKDAFSEIFDLEASPAEDQSLPPKNYKIRKRKGEKTLKEPVSLKTGHFLTQKFDSCTCPNKNVVKHGASRKKGLLSCC